MTRSNVKKKDIKLLLSRHYFMKTMEKYLFIYTIPLGDFFPAIDKTLGINSTEIILPKVIRFSDQYLDGYCDDYDANYIITSIFASHDVLNEELATVVRFFIYDIFYLADRKRKEQLI